MGPIGSVGGNSNGGIYPTQLPQSLIPASLGETPVSVTGASSSKSSQSLLTIQSSVSQLFQSIGGGLEQNEMLKALIALLLLSALLRSNNQEEQTGLQMLHELGSGQGSIGIQGQLVSFYSSSTSFVMESSVNSISVSNQASSAISASGVMSASAVSQIDVVA